jgi:glycogen synthase
MAEVLAREFAFLGNAVTVVTDSPCDSRETTLYEVVRTESNIARWQAFRCADVILTMNVSLPAVLISILAAKPLVISHHGVYGGLGTRNRIKARLRLFLTRYYRNISCSEFVASRIPVRSTIVRNAFEIDRFSRLGKRKFGAFVVCARLVSEKGVDIAVRALAIIQRKFDVSASLTIIGSGVERTALEMLAVEEGVKAAVQFRGELTGETLAQELADHFCMLVPSRAEEGFGIVALEGLAACGRVIVSNYGALPETVGRFGVVAACTPEGFAVAMCEIVRKVSEGSVVDSSALQRYLLKHTPATIARGYLDVLFSKLDD